MTSGAEDALAARPSRTRPLARSFVLACLALVLAGPASAESVRQDRDAGVIDWTRGLVIASGAAAADLRARSPAVARAGAERRARRQAEQKLERIAETVPLAGGGEVGAALDDLDEGDAAEILSRAAARAIDVDVDYGSDGSVVVRLGLPLEALRSAVAGPGAAPAGRDSPSGVIVRARDTLDEPALGLKLVAGDERYAPPVVFTRRAAAGDARLGDDYLEAQATARRGAAIEVDLDPDELALARDAGALVVVVLGRSGDPS